MIEKHVHHHVRRLRHHRNSLYGIVFILLVFQVISFISVSSQISNANSQQQSLEREINLGIFSLNEKIEGLRKDNQFAINSITQELTEQKEGFQGEIDILKASQQDFSGIIEDVIKGVVTIRTDSSAGTGFIIEDNGYIVTNFHVLQNSDSVEVQTFDGKPYEASIIGVDEETDIALIKIQRLNSDKLTFAGLDEVQIGEKVIAIGNPLGLEFTVTEGIISALNRRGPNGLENYLQTDVVLNPGNSGGPLINKEGKVVGINNFKIGGAEGLGFALESNVVKQRINQIYNGTLIE